MVKKVIVVVSGAPGVDTKRFSKSLALELGLNYLSRDEIAEKIARDQGALKEIVASGLEDGRYANEACKVISFEGKKRGIIADYSLAAWKSNADLRIFLQSFKKNSEYEENIMRRQRVLETTGFDQHSTSSYDLVLNADKLGIENSIAVVRKYLEKMR